MRKYHQRKTKVSEMMKKFRLQKIGKIMKCPFCSATDTQVIDSRVNEAGILLETKKVP